LLKLFAFCSKTSIDKRHEVHEQQYKNLLDLLDKRIKVGFGSKTEIIDSLEELFAGLLGAGAERNWCARTFFPLAECLLSQEVISNDKETKKRAAEKINRGDTLTWIETIEHMNTFYSLSSQKFLARGGEMLYLQLCNLFSQSQEKIDKWTYNIGLQEYFDISKLRRSLNNKLISLRKSQLSGLEKLAYYIEQFDEQTWSKLQNMEKQKVLKCEWCPQETWPETLFFAIELRNILSASLDPVERVEHLKYVCSLQVLRTLCAQSLRYVCDYKSNYKFAKAPLGYLWIMTSVEAGRALKVPAASNLIRMTDIIYNSLRHPELINWTITSQKIPRTTFEDLYKEADDAYGHSLFLSLGKSMELIIPRKGSGARFIANDKLVR
ncbi:MAG: hypothetical protein QME68_08685, partial [Elusimicrobiota bacterium]|nr:hypothetical protein [Elusimicrobiota bacterium]